MKRIVLSWAARCWYRIWNRTASPGMRPFLRRSAAGTALPSWLAGREARRYITAARKLGIDDRYRGRPGILVTRLNATLLAGALGERPIPGSPPPTTRRRVCLLREDRGHGRVIPGPDHRLRWRRSSPSGSVQISCVNATSVDAIYSADPKKEPRAKAPGPADASPAPGHPLVDRLKAGESTVFDMVAPGSLERSGVPLAVLDGRDPAIPPAGYP